MIMVPFSYKGNNWTLETNNAYLKLAFSDKQSLGEDIFLALDKVRESFIPHLKNQPHLTLELPVFENASEFDWLNILMKFFHSELSILKEVNLIFGGDLKQAIQSLFLFVGYYASSERTTGININAHAFEQKFYDPDLLIINFEELRKAFCVEEIMLTDLGIFSLIRNLKISLKKSAEKLISMQDIKSFLNLFNQNTVVTLLIDNDSEEALLKYTELQKEINFRKFILQAEGIEVIRGEKTKTISIIFGDAPPLSPESLKAIFADKMAYEINLFYEKEPDLQEANIVEANEILFDKVATIQDIHSFNLEAKFKSNSSAVQLFAYYANAANKRPYSNHEKFRHSSKFVSEHLFLKNLIDLKINDLGIENLEGGEHYSSLLENLPNLKSFEVIYNNNEIPFEAANNISNSLIKMKFLMRINFDFRKKSVMINKALSSLLESCLIYRKPVDHKRYTKRNRTIEYLFQSTNITLENFKLRIKMDEQEIDALIDVLSKFRNNCLYLKIEISINILKAKNFEELEKFSLILVALKPTCVLEIINLKINNEPISDYDFGLFLSCLSKLERLDFINKNVKIIRNLKNEVLEVYFDDHFFLIPKLSELLKLENYIYFLNNMEINIKKMNVKDIGELESILSILFSIVFVKLDLLIDELTICHESILNTDNSKLLELCNGFYERNFENKEVCIVINETFSMNIFKYKEKHLGIYYPSHKTLLLEEFKTSKIGSIYVILPGKSLDLNGIINIFNSKTFKFPKQFYLDIFYEKEISQLSEMSKLVITINTWFEKSQILIRNFEIKFKFDEKELVIACNVYRNFKDITVKWCSALESKLNIKYNEFLTLLFEGINCRSYNILFIMDYIFDKSDLLNMSNSIIKSQNPINIARMGVEISLPIEYIVLDSHLELGKTLHVFPESKLKIMTVSDSKLSMENSLEFYKKGILLIFNFLNCTYISIEIYNLDFHILIKGETPNQKTQEFLIQSKICPSFNKGEFTRNMINMFVTIINSYPYILNKEVNVFVEEKFKINFGGKSKTTQIDIKGMLDYKSPDSLYTPNVPILYPVLSLNIDFYYLNRESSTKVITIICHNLFTSIEDIIQMNKKNILHLNISFGMSREISANFIKIVFLSIHKFLLRRLLSANLFTDFSVDLTSLINYKNIPLLPEIQSIISFNKRICSKRKKILKLIRNFHSRIHKCFKRKEINQEIAEMIFF